MMTLRLVLGIIISVSTAPVLEAQISSNPTSLPGITTREILQSVKAQDSLLARLRTVPRIRASVARSSPDGAVWVSVMDARPAGLTSEMLSSIQNDLKVGLIGEEFAPLRYHVVSSFPASYEVLRTVEGERVVSEEDFQRQVNALASVTRTIRSYSTAAPPFTLRMDVKPAGAYIQFSAPGGTLRETYPNVPITGMLLGKYDFKVTAGARVVTGMVDFFIEPGRTLSCVFDVAPLVGGRCVFKQ